MRAVDLDDLAHERAQNGAAADASRASSHAPRQPISNACRDGCDKLAANYLAFIQPASTL